MMGHGRHKRDPREAYSGPFGDNRNAKPDNDVRLMQQKGSGGYGRIPGNLAGHEKRNVSAVTTP